MRHLRLLDNLELLVVLSATRRTAYHLRRIGQSRVEGMSKFHFVGLDVRLNTSARNDLST